MNPIAMFHTIIIENHLETLSPSSRKKPTQSIQLEPM
jgi:hypothetical protein